MRICSIEDCGNKSRVHGWCQAHYMRWKRNGDPTAGRTPNGELLRFINEVVLPHNGDECLVWPYSRNREGYGHILLDGKERYVHRLACEHVYGPAPGPKFEAAHNCGNGHQGCVNPGHLRWATRSENFLDKQIHKELAMGRWAA